MTNREILKTSKHLLGEVDRQRLFLLRVESTPVPCLACKRPVNAFEAAGIDLDDYDFGNRTFLTFRRGLLSGRHLRPTGGRRPDPDGKGARLGRRGSRSASQHRKDIST